jgi:hypothetical protein
MRAAFAVLVFVVGTLVAGCGGKMGALPSPTCTTASPSYGSGGLVTRRSEELRPVLHLRLFARPRTPKDVLSRGHIPHYERSQDSRLLSPPRNGHGALYVMPDTDPTRLCINEVPMSTGSVNPTGCGTGFAYYFSGVRRPDGCTTGYEVFGVAPDDVIRVGIFLNRRFHHVPIHDNLFWYRTPFSGNADETLNAVVLRYRDGSVLVTDPGVGWNPSKAAVSKT